MSGIFPSLIGHGDILPGLMGTFSLASGTCVQGVGGSGCHLDLDLGQPGGPAIASEVRKQGAESRGPRDPNLGAGIFSCYRVTLQSCIS